MVSKVYLNTTLRIVLSYLIISGAYIIFSDLILASIINDKAHLTLFQTYKGWGFVLITSILLFVLLFRLLKKLEMEKRQLDETQQSLKKSEELFRLQYENSMDAILVTQTDGMIYSANPAACKMFDRTETEIKDLGRNALIDLTDPKLSVALEQRKQNGNFKGELNFVKKDGTIFPGELTSTVYIDSDGIERTSMIIRDVQERKSYEKSLLESEERYKALVEQATDALFVHDFNGKFVEVNQQACDSLGYTREELLKLSVFDVELDFDLELAHREWAKIKGNSLFTLYGHQKRKDGSVFPVEVHFGSFRWKDKRLFLGLARDITERERIEQEIKNKSDNLSKLFDISLDLIESVNTKTVLQRIVQNSVNLIGLDSGAIYLLEGSYLTLEATTPDLPSDFPDEFRKAKIDNHPHIFNVVQSKSIMILQDVNKTKFSSEEQIIMNSRKLKSLVYLPLISEKKVIGIIILGTVNREYSFSTSEIDLCRTLANLASLSLTNSILFEKLNQNLSELKQVIEEKIIATEALQESESRFHSMFENHHAVMMLINPVTGKIIDANPSAAQFYGYTTEQLSKMNVDEINMMPKEKLIKEMNSASVEARTYFNFTHKLKSGEIRNVEVYTSPIKVKGVSVLFSIIHDITERKKAEEKVLQSREMLRALTAKLENAKEEERINLSRELHDNLGQSLTGLKMDTAWLQRKIKEFNINNLDTFIEKTSSMSSLIDEIINHVRRISSELRPNILDYMGLVESLEWQLQDFGKRSETKVNFLSTIKEINVDQKTATSIFRILQEAFTNIMRHANASYVEMTIDETSEYYMIHLIDNGTGISIEKISNIRSLGIIGMNERTLQFNGELKISNSITGGTDVFLNIPKGKNK